MGSKTSTPNTSQPWRRSFAQRLLLASFLVSGFSALIYQTCWQRSLYGVLGVDIDSVTIIVSVFMCGIGLGSVLGGSLADRCPSYRIEIYAALELGIAVYGAATLLLLPWLSLALSDGAWSGLGSRAAVCFIFLLPPTILMGATLPVLTMAFNERIKNVGVSVGNLYFVNTLGAALGAGAVPLILFRMASIPQVLMVAICGNLAIAALTFMFVRSLPQEFDSL